jgi:hypothetical protein
MTKLNHPLKRLSFLLFIGNGTALIGLALLPIPLEISSYSAWKDAAASEIPDRQVVRIDTGCAATEFGGLETFARDFFIAYGSINEYARVVTEMRIERGEPFSIAPTIDITEEQEAAIFSQLSDTERLCLKTDCAARLDAELFSAILNSCGTLVGQYRDDIHDIRWLISNNLEDTFPWSLAVFLMSVAFLLTSVLYDRTLGPIIKWVRTGSW